MTPTPTDRLPPGRTGGVGAHPTIAPATTSPTTNPGGPCSVASAWRVEVRSPPHRPDTHHRHREAARAAVDRTRGLGPVRIGTDVGNAPCQRVAEQPVSAEKPAFAEQPASAKEPDLAKRPASASEPESARVGDSRPARKPVPIRQRQGVAMVT